MVCGLHKIDTYNLNTPNSPLMMPPRDLVELGDRIHAWWSLFCVDRLSSLALEIPATVRHDDESVTTVWPCPSEYYDNGQVIYTPCRGFPSLRSFFIDASATFSVYDNVYAFRAKGCAMFYHGGRLASSFRVGLDVTHDARVAIGVTSLLADTIALYRQQKCPSFDRARSQLEDHIHDSSLIFALSMTYGALVQLLQIPTDQDVDLYPLRFNIARTCARFAAEVCQVDLDLLNTAIWLPWLSAYEVLAWEPIPSAMLGDSDAINAAKADLDGLIDAFKKFGEHYLFDFKSNGTFRRLTFNANTLSQISA